MPRFVSNNFLFHFCHLPQFSYWFTFLRTIQPTKWFDRYLFPINIPRVSPDRMAIVDPQKRIIVHLSIWMGFETDGASLVPTLGIVIGLESYLVTTAAMKRMRGREEDLPSGIGWLELWTATDQHDFKWNYWNTTDFVRQNRQQKTERILHFLSFIGFLNDPLCCLCRCPVRALMRVHYFEGIWMCFWDLFFFENCVGLHATTACRQSLQLDQSGANLWRRHLKSVARNKPRTSHLNHSWIRKFIATSCCF